MRQRPHGSRWQGNQTGTAFGGLMGFAAPIHTPAARIEPAFEDAKGGGRSRVSLSSSVENQTPFGSVTQPLHIAEQTERGPTLGGLGAICYRDVPKKSRGRPHPEISMQQPLPSDSADPFFTAPLADTDPEI